MRASRLLVVIAAGLLALGAGAAQAAASARLPALTPSAGDSLTRALAQGRLTEAQYALQRARSLFRRDEVEARYGPVARPGPRDATLVLRDLVLRLGQLSPAERELARGILARPDDASNPTEHHYAPEALDSYFYVCAPTFCVNWVTVTPDAPSSADSNGDGTPDYVETVVATLQQVWDTEVTQLGFRAPKSDATSPNPFNVDEKIDIYLVDLGASGGLYGYCTTDDPNVMPGSTYAGFDASAYCVLDNDFAPGQYGVGATGVEALAVTAAHEFFHAVQFAYSFLQDRWLLEATATLMEDVVYDDVNDNYQYLEESPLTHPEIPLDLNEPDLSQPLSGFKYGSFVFFKLLTERYDPTVIRGVFEAGDGIPGGPALPSIYAVDAALAARGSSVRSAFARFGVANLWPPAFYEEGADYILLDKQGRPFQAAAPLPRPFVLTARKPTLGAKTAQLDHLTTAYAVLQPGAGVRKGAKLQVTFDLPPYETGPEVSLVTYSKSGRLGVVAVRLNAQGDAVRRIPFGKLRQVVLVVTNAGMRFDGCYEASTPPFFSCSGTPLDDGLLYTFSAKLVQ